jgi:hypothetical protein
MDHALYQPLLTAVIVSYAKPFTTNNGLGVLKKRWTKFDNPKWARCHERILKARHELFAHSDEAVRRVKICPPSQTSYLEGYKSVGVGFGIAGYMPTISEAETMAAVSYDLSRRLFSECERLIKELYDGMDLPTRDFLLRYDDGL